MPRKAYGPMLIEKLTNQPAEINNDVTTYRIDPVIYKETGELVKLGEGKTVPSSESYENAKRMKTELDTLEKFTAIGNYREVAEKYGVGKTAANDLHRKLRRDAEKMEGQAKVENTSTESREPCLGQSNDDSSISPKEGDLTSSESGISETEKSTCFGKFDALKELCSFDICRDKEACKVVTNNPVEETIDDLQGLVEPEPPWKLDLSDEALERIIEELNKPVTDDQIWQGIEEDLKDLRERAHKRADQEITNRFLRLMNQ